MTGGSEILCAWVRLDGNDCEEKATFSLVMHGGNSGYDGKHLEACDRHLADFAHNMKELYAVDSVTIEEFPR